MVVSMVRCTTRVIVRDACRDVIATIIKEKENTCLIYMKIFISQNSIQIFAQTLLVCPSRDG